MKTKGALIWEFNQPWSIEEIEIGDPRKDEVKIQMEAAGMCHSDHHLVTGGIPMAGFPVLGGHEGAGIVTEVGPGVEDLAPGDHVVLSFIPSCGKCPSCQSGLRNLCDLGAGLLNGAAVSDGTFRIQAKGRNVYPMTLLGTFSPWMVVHKSSVVKIDPTVPFEVAALVGCGVTTGYGSAVRTDDIRPGQDVAIVGVGGVLAFSVSGRIREFGIRLAMGSPPSRLLTKVIAEGAIMAATGVLVGGVGGYALAKLIGSYVMDVRMPSLLPVIISAAVLLAAAVIASAWPASRAARIDVVEALRSD
jgi:hypothetical protein